jgi:lysophospholipid acyltransferase (LPLAT)-like uncharacterized protein
MKKRLLDSEIGSAVIAWIAAHYIKLVWATSRWRWVGREHVDQKLSAGQPCLCAFWHGRILMMPKAWGAGGPFFMLISGHRDGRLIARTIAWFRISTVVGSSSRGAAGGLRGMVDKLRGGEWAAITPDGPRGPRMRAQAGVASIAMLAGVPILPVSFSTTRGKLLGSWDRMLVPLPFGRGVFVFEPPITVPQDADDVVLERVRADVEAALIRATIAADRLCGRDSPAPDAPWR